MDILDLLGWDTEKIIVCRNDIDSGEYPVVLDDLLDGHSLSDQFENLQSRE